MIWGYPPFGKPLNGNMTPILTANIWMIIPKANFSFVFSQPNGPLIPPDLGAIIYRAHHVHHDLMPWWGHDGHDSTECASYQRAAPRTTEFKIIKKPITMSNHWRDSVRWPRLNRIFPPLGIDFWTYREQQTQKRLH